MQNLPKAPPLFASKKKKILEQLAVPDSEYTDASPKGSVDEGIRELIDEINAHEGVVTTSSCAGRVSVFLEGRKTHLDSDETVRLAGVGGKGGGGKWLFVSHDPVQVQRSDDTVDWAAVLGFQASDVGLNSPSSGGGDEERRLIHLKFEPMILHILTASLEHAQLILRCGLQAGFRESGAVNICGTASEQATPMVAIRSMGLGFESLIGVEINGNRQCTVSNEYLHTLVQLANERFDENYKRIDRFRKALGAAFHQGPRKNEDGLDWEDAAERRERKRAEGLKRSRQQQNPGLS